MIAGQRRVWLLVGGLVVCLAALFWAAQGGDSSAQSGPTVSVDAVIDDYCRSGFGPAAAQIRAYFARIEQVNDAVAAQDLGDRARARDASPAFP